MDGRTLHTIAIIGAGYSGTATAIQLLRAVPARPTRVVLVERQAELGRGAAYRRRRYPYVLNVPASRMSATTGDPGEFLRYAQRSQPAASGDDYLPRELYGDYLQHLLRAAVDAAAPRLEFAHMRGEAIDVVPGPPGTAAKVLLRDGTQFDADAVVLALGNPPPRLPAGVRAAAGLDGLQCDPWQDPAEPPRAGPLLVLGSGLTMVDAVCAAVHSHPAREIHVLSRHGLVPSSQTPFSAEPLAPEAAASLSGAGASVSRILATVRDLVRATTGQGGDWRQVITQVRHVAPLLWQGLGDDERRRFLRHVRCYWDLHRHRVPGTVLARIDALRAAGQLTVHAGRLLALEPGSAGLRATWRERCGGGRRVLDVAEAINCMGPDYDVAGSDEPLWRSLLARGLVARDALGLGVRTDRDHALVGRDGRVAPYLYYVGPMLRADHWEATAVGELRSHVDRLAHHLLTHAG